MHPPLQNTELSQFKEDEHPLFFNRMFGTETHVNIPTNGHGVSNRQYTTPNFHAPTPASGASPNSTQSTALSPQIKHSLISNNPQQILTIHGAIVENIPPEWSEAVDNGRRKFKRRQAYLFDWQCDTEDGQPIYIRWTGVQDVNRCK